MIASIIIKTKKYRPVKMINGQLKKNKNVLMLCYYFPPLMEVGSLRSRKYAQYLSRYGWSCEVITAYKGKDVASMFPESVSIHLTPRIDFHAICYAAVKRLRHLRKIMGEIVSYLNLKKNKKRETLKRIEGLGKANMIMQWFLLPDSQFLWILLALPKALWVAHRCDVIYSSSSPTSAHILGLIIHKITQKPWVADYRDSWTLNTEWFPPTRFHRWLGERLDRACVKNARYAVNVTEPITKEFKKKYFEYADKCVTIRNGYDESDVAGFRGRKLAEDYILFTSIGSIYGGRDPSTFLEVVKEFFDEEYVTRDNFRLMLINALDPQLNMLIEKLHLEDVVKVMPWMPQFDAFEYLAESHVALLIGSDMAKTAMTTKVYEYAGMEKLIFALVPDGPVKDFVEKCSGVVADPKDKAQIRAALRTLINKCRNGQIANLNLPAIASQYERSALALQLAELLNKAAVKRNEETFRITLIGIVNFLFCFAQVNSGDFFL